MVVLPDASFGVLDDEWGVKKVWCWGSGRSRVAVPLPDGRGSVWNYGTCLWKADTLAAEDAGVN
jgi:hypothetical protein